MKKLLLTLLTVFVSLVASADEYSTGVLGKDAFTGSSSPMSGTFNDVSWSLAYEWTSGSYFGSDATKGFQIGSGSAQLKTAIFSTEEIQGTITSVKVNGSIGSSGGCSVSVKVGGVDFKYNSSNTSEALTTTATSYEFKGEATGKIEITYTNSKKKATYIKQIDVVYSTDSGSLQPAELSFPQTEYTALLGEDFIEPTLSQATNVKATYSSSNQDVASVNSETGEVTPIKVGRTVITASVEANETYNKDSASYTLIVKDPNAKPWVRVNSSAEIVTGVSYIITAGAYDQNSSTCTVLTTYGSNLFNIDKNVSIASDYSISELPEGTLTFELEEAGNGLYYLKSGNSYVYHNSSDGNKASLGSTKSKLSITYSEESGFVVIKKDGESRYLGCNASSPRIVFYGSEPSTSTATNQPLRLYYQEGSFIAKKNPGLSFAETNFEFEEGSEDAKNFEAPKLINPNKLPISVESSNENVVEAIEHDGQVMIDIKGVGTATITVTSEETDEFAAGKASFTITIVEKQKTLVTLSFDKSEFTGFVDDIISEGLPVLAKSADVEVTYTTSNKAVADVESDGSILYLVGIGTATITASFNGNETYNSAFASYTVTVKDPNEVFYSQKGDGFEFDNISLSGSLSYVWQKDTNYGYLKASGYTGGKNNEAVAVAYATIDATEYKDLSLTFSAAYNYFGSIDAIGQYCSIVAREVGDTEWQPVDADLKTADDLGWTFVDNDAIDLSAYSNKKVQVGFKYVSTAEVAGTWEVKNIKVSGVVGQAPVAPTTVRPVFTVADEDWANQATSTVFKGATVTISAPEDAEEGWIMSYTVNDGEEDYAEEAVILTITENTTISAYIDDEENGIVTKTYNVAKLPEVVLNPAFGAVAEGTEVTVTCSVEDATLSGYVGDDEVDGETLPYTFTVTDEVEVALYVEHPKYIESDEVLGTYTIKLPELRPHWEAVTSMAQVQDGDIVTFMAKEYTGKVSGKNVTYPDVIMSDVSSDVITGVEFVYENYQLPVETAKFTLNTVGDGVVTLYSEEANNGEGGYLSANAKNKVKFVSEAKELTLSINNDGAAIVGGVTLSETEYTLRYNPNVANPVNISTARFAFYASGQQDIYMYRMIDSGLDAPELSISEGQVVEIGHKILISCAKGAHIWTRETVLESTENGANKIVAKEDGWMNHETNMVEYEITELEKRIEVKAVSTDGKVHSKVLNLDVDANGKTTSIREIAAEGGEAEWYDLQGRRVAMPAKGGVFILKQGSKVSKQVF